MACTSLPVINNGYITASDTGRVEYECLAGFNLIGSKVIECDAVSGWAAAPSCEVIKNDVSFTDASKNEYRFVPEWWYIFLSIMLCILLLLCIISFIWCCMCRKWAGATIHPVNEWRNKKTDVENDDHGNEQKKWKYKQDPKQTDPKFNKSMLNDGLTPVESNQVVPIVTSTEYVQRKPSADTEHHSLSFCHSKHNTEDYTTANKGPTASHKVLQLTNAQFLTNKDKADIPSKHHPSHGCVTDPNTGIGKYSSDSDESRWMAPAAENEANRGFKTPTDTVIMKQIYDSSTQSSRSEHQKESRPKKRDNSLQYRPKWGPHSKSGKVVFYP